MSCARSSWFAMMSSNHFRRMPARSFAVFLRHAENALAAASTARRVSLSVMSATSAIVCPVAGLVTAKRAPLSAECQPPSMKASDLRRDGSFSVNMIVLGDKGKRTLRNCSSPGAFRIQMDALCIRKWGQTQATHVSNSPSGLRNWRRGCSKFHGRYGVEQRARVDVFRVLQDVGNRAALDHPAAAEDESVVGE